MNQIYLLDKTYMPEYISGSPGAGINQYALPTFSEISKGILTSLPDAFSCIVTEELNGIFELEMEYPSDGYGTGSLGLLHIIATKSCPACDISNDNNDPLIDALNNYQLFRIYEISHTLSDRITIKAEHVSYDACGALVVPRSGNSVDTIAYTNKVDSSTPYDTIENILDDINDKIIPPGPYAKTITELEDHSRVFYRPLAYDDRATRYGISKTFNEADRRTFPVYNAATRNNNINFDRPYMSLKSVLMGEDNSLLYSYGNSLEFYYSGFNIYVTYGDGRSVGFDPINVRYGLNLTEFTYVFDTTDTYRYILPHDPKYINASNVVGDLNPDHDFSVKDLIERTNISEEVRNLFGNFTNARKTSVDAKAIWMEYHPDGKYNGSTDIEDTPRELRNAAFKSSINKAFNAGFFDSLMTVSHTVDVSFESLKRYDEFSDLDHLNNVYVGGLVNVHYPKLNLNITEKCVKTVYDVLSDKYTEITLSTLPKTLSS